ncbi:LysR family transcriptional regulator [Leisingera sp. S232]|uniref:LysR family transcriptional regulator n=1 Tax=Leisingera sp. S232 TaxID=3415132 RepID=UPI00086D851B|nr:hypothetical protein AB838_16745 [Rhodobacteraceae bacterium (ex Bugula neritina AB1)]
MQNFKSLQVFFWVCKLGNFSAAAERLNMTQPNVSQRISALETLFGKSLLNRKIKPITPTSDGQLLLRHCETILRQVAALETDLELHQKQARIVRLGVSETIAQIWLSEFLSQVRLKFPRVRFEIEVDVTSALKAALEAGELDLSFMLGPAPSSDYASIQLGAFPLKFYCVPGLVPSGHLTVEDLLRLPVITYPKRAYPYGALREALYRLLGEAPKIITSTSLATIRSMTLDGTGVALVADGAIHSGLAPRDAATDFTCLTSDISLDPLCFFGFYPYSPGSGMLGEITEIAQNVAQKRAPIWP